MFEPNYRPQFCAKHFDRFVALGGGENWKKLPWNTGRKCHVDKCERKAAGIEHGAVNQHG